MTISPRYRIALFASSCASLPLIEQLHQLEMLVGVVVSNREDGDAQQLLATLSEANIQTLAYVQGSNPTVAKSIQSWQANIGLIFSFPHRLPPSIIALFSGALFNVHASLLPDYRGSAPLFWQLKNQQTNSGISIIKVEEKLDEGPIVWQQPLVITPLDTLNSLTSRVMSIVPSVVVSFLQQLANGAIDARLQQGRGCHAPRPQTEDVQVNWATMSSAQICALARACNPTYGGALLCFNGVTVGLYQATEIALPTFGVNAGTVVYVGEPHGLVIATFDGAIRLDVMNLKEGVFSGLNFAEHFCFDAGMSFD
ncbi:methionyl-tRNA formyltransferase [Shewanella sp. Choline-02u-19]|jgi:methionyl-tRNA formyltransferase|uniref:methionyl-tRNA formyltransferase n=1 Tax=unclassified Shewanella TaxID=196818 RepID=UPI000C32A367|nr:MULTISPECIES: formyltransferase family protein [unclassified Shewanella]PKG58752.1 methionyl-tRNA formyltransferase [Shewanella sp. GutDb-MelDb]PKH55794.1 methionyl-tRNA formyltransferase [Shewanella sp. Bg11-22]PKI26792.1 methionyl-tRNA formyltransferase [Shewanella sp. Choline-02u-19]